MRKRRSVWPFVFWLAAGLALIGLTFTLDIVRREGLDGLWHRKKSFIERAQPEAGPLLDEAEKRVHGKQETER